MPRTAPDGSAMTPAMSRAADDMARDKANGYVTPDGRVTKKYNAGGIYDGTGADPTMDQHADALHPVPRR